MHILADVLFYMFVSFGMITTVHLGLYIGGANIYDIWQYRRQARQAGTRRRKRLPGVSVVIPAYNEEVSIERCLESVRMTKYPHLKVMVHNDISTDSTADIIRAYQQKYPKFDLRLVNRRHRAGKAGGVNYLIQKYAKTELVMTLDADCILRPDSIRKAVEYFDDPKVVGVAANVRLLDKRSVLGILQQFEHLIGYRSKKFYTIANCEFIVGGVASTYRRDILDKVGYYGTDTQTEDIGLSMKIVALGNKEHRLVYGSDVVAMAEGAHTFKMLLKQRYRWKMGSLQNLLIHARLLFNPSRKYSPSLTFYRLPMAFFSEIMLLMQPLIVGFIFYLSFHYHTFGLFLGAYLTITLYVLLTIWPDEHSTIARKLQKSLYAPFLYFVFYIMDTVQVIAIVRCLLNPKMVARQTKEQQAAWTPPTRSGQQASFF
ncbi:MAG TPA: glycosyltransferase family 2 protein [Candidatus Saccharimonadales bacterium]|jgi:cellulose synthase/poly-beta-1,6-N-acetylglucosamine synthase-like glycosyltransferase|nr:glycosyltransferase family 2 protein [Candidatus Saccharimonadales bacterium]